VSRPAAALTLSVAQRGALEGLASSSSASHRQVQRAQVLLLAANGEANTRIAERVGVTVVTVRAWRARFLEAGVGGLGAVRPGRGRKPSIPSEKVEAIVRTTLHEKPAGEAHWSCRTMAKSQGVSPATVQRIWSVRGLKPRSREDVQAF
jgi:transposase